MGRKKIAVGSRSRFCCRHDGLCIRGCLHKRVVANCFGQSVDVGFSTSFIRFKATSLRWVKERMCSMTLAWCTNAKGGGDAKL